MDEPMRHYAQAPDLDIKYYNTTVIKRVLSKNKISLWYDKNIPEIDYFYANEKYHIIKRDLPKTGLIYRGSPLPPAKGKEILALNDLVHIVRFTNKDYIIFDSNSSFFYFNTDSTTVLGPFKTLGIDSYCNKNYVRNDIDILKMKYPSYWYDNIFITITFNRKTKKITTDDLKVALLSESGVWPCVVSDYDYLQHYR
jgi:hypothetical protein